MRFSILFLLTFLTINCPGQELKNMQYTVLWGVINPKGDTSYLFGVFHDIGDKFLDQYPVIKTELRKVHAIAMESVQKKKGKVETTDHSNWYNSISKPDFDLINDYFKKGAKEISKHARLSLSMFKRLNYSPLDVYVTFLHTEVYVICGIHLAHNEQPVEEYLTDWCKYHNDRHHLIPLIGLETSDDIEDNIVGITDKDIVDSMRAAILHPETQDAGCNLWNNYRNMSGFNYDFKKAAETIDTTNLYLLNKRNDHWMPEIKSAINNDRTFIAVGLLHLAYKDGLINQLIASGYTVFPISMKQS